MQIELVVFDMAGTTVLEGGAVYRSLRETLAANGLELTADDIAPFKGHNKREALRLLIENSPLRDELLPGLNAIHEDFVERMIAFYRSDESVSEMPGARDLFQRLHQHGVKVALNTGFSRNIAQTLIDRFDWEPDGLIDASVTSDEIERGRPHPDMIRHLMRQLGVRDSLRVAKVGDTPADLWEGRNAGCGMIVGLAPDAAAHAALADKPHDHLIKSLTELPKLLRL